MSNKLSKKELIVLIYFIEGESKEIRKWQNNIKKDNQFQSFIVYPAKIESDLSGEVSRATTGPACKKLLKMGILNAKKDYSGLKGGTTTHYSLKSDLQTIRSLLQLITDKYNPPIIIKILSNEYFMHHLNESLVKEVLSEKAVTISRYISLLEWDKNEAHKIFDDCDEKFKYPTHPKEKFEEVMQNWINDFDASWRINENEYMKKLHTLYTNFLNDCEDNSFDSARHYTTNVYNTIQNVEKNDLIYGLKIDRIHAAMPIIHLKLPVFKDNIPTNQKMIIIKELNPVLEDRYPLLQNNYSGIVNHYEHFQYERLLLPILALIQTSPSALIEFLCGDWKSFEYRFAIDGKCADDGVISKLLWLAINDFLITPQIPTNGVVEKIYSRSYPSHNLPSTLPNDLWNDCRSLCANASSLEDITQICSFIVIRLKNIYDISFNPGFYISAEPQSTSWITISTNIRPDIAFHLLRIYHIKNPKDLISKLKDTKNPVFNHIRSKMSNIMQNAMTFYDSDESPSVEFQKMLVDELNLAFISGDFYSEKIFSDVIAQINIDETPLKYTHTKISDVVKHLSEHRYSRKEIINKRHHYNSSSLIYYNRLIFDKIFMDELEPDWSHIQREN